VWFDHGILFIKTDVGLDFFSLAIVESGKIIFLGE
jgi:hypothetical protein